MTPFARLALFAANGFVFGALFAVGEYVSWGVAAAAGIGALIGAVFSTLELAPSGSGRVSEEALQTGASDEGGKREARDFVMRRRERRDIERSAQRAADEQQ